jgi:hypothetical protein
MHEGNRYGVPIFFDSVIFTTTSHVSTKPVLPIPTTAGPGTIINASAKLTIKDKGTTIQYGTIADPDMQSGASNFTCRTLEHCSAKTA